MKKVSAVNNDRIRTMYVDRKVSIKNVSSVSPIDVIKSTENNTSSANENFLLFTSSLYENLMELREHYKKFYLHQQELENVLDSFKESKYDNSLHQLIQQLEELVEKYNKAFLSLKSFEEKLNIQQFSKSIVDTLISYQIQLDNIGIVLLDDLMLSFNPSILRDNLSFNSDYIFFLFDYKNGLIKKLIRIFKSIKATVPTAASNYLKEPHVSSSLTGLLLDKKL
ncbi:hypothetical protein [Alkaliphilus peptidifermentans]|uniref:Uncharacterized protein n=1 Tax=Alkaliphilus peptidifermentans DSM 18978 TaxID=1120976 RepID=A0A1G5BZE5_9FIRM|nr:hypothetical protein [Alkaliphilus peptidifermentans]SCX95501.1 hypothetical protein SAMN03080606_00570 [Alkaliphilus peptidifermentans DSM 18978]